MGLAQAANAAEIKVITDRTAFHLRPIFDQFEHQTGIKVKAAFIEEGGLPVRLQANPTEADVIVTTDSAILSMAKQKGWTRALPASKEIDALSKDYVDAGRQFVALSYRVRAMVYNPSTIGDRKISDYSDLASGKFKVCMRPINHAYNINLVSQMINDRGEQYARDWVKGVVKNLSVKPQGNDRTQGINVADNKCEVTLMNSYYYGLMLSNPAQREAATKIRLYFPNQEGKGSYALVSGAALTKTKNADAIKLINFMLSPMAQAFTANVNYEYPVRSDIDLPVMVQTYGDGQPGVEKGRAKINVISLDKIAQHREEAVQIINEALSQQ